MRQMETKDRTIQQFIKKVRRRFLLQKEISHLVVLTVFSSGIALLVNVLALFLPLYHAALYGWLVLGAGVILSVVWTGLQWPSDRKAASWADQAGFQERLSTSVEYRGCQDDMAVWLKEDTIRHMQGFDIRQKLKLQWPVRKLTYAAVLFLAFLICSMLPSQAKQDALRHHELKKMIKAETETVENAQKAVDASLEQKGISKEDAKALKKMLQMAKEELESSKDTKEMEQIKKELSDKLIRSMAKQQDSELLKNMQPLVQGEDLQSNSQYRKALEELAKQSPLLENVLSELESIPLSAEARQALIEALNEALQDGKITEKELMKALRSLQEDNADAAAGTIQAQLESEGSATVSANEKGGGKSGENNATMAANDGNNGKNGENGGNGTGEGASGASGSLGASGAGTGTGYNTGSKNGNEEDADSAAEKVVVPNQKTGSDSNLTAERQKGSSTKTRSKQEKAWAGDKVDYSTVAGDYQKQAYAELEKSEIPPQMKNYVKDYFTGIAGSGEE